MKMTSGILFSLILLLLALSCDAAEKDQHFPLSSRSLPKTTSGKYCSIPFTYKGVTYYSCTKVDWNRLWCSLDHLYKGRWGNCVNNPTPNVCLPKTTSGKYCSIPFTYKGVTYNSCTKVDWHRLWCSLDHLYKGRWGNCVNPTPTTCLPKTTSGKYCSIPFTYKGVKYNSCTKVDWHRLWCSLDHLYKGRWGNCVNPTACPPKTTSGKYCSIPFTYKGVTYNSCTKADWHTFWCSLDPWYKGRWGNCDCIENSLRIRKEFTSMTNEDENDAYRYEMVKNPDQPETNATNYE